MTDAPNHVVLVVDDDVDVRQSLAEVLADHAYETGSQATGRRRSPRCAHAR